MNRLARTHWIGEPPNINSVMKEYVSKINKNFQDGKHIKDYVKNYDIDLNIREDQITIIEEFRKKFLIHT